MIRLRPLLVCLLAAVLLTAGRADMAPAAQ